MRRSAALLLALVASLPVSGDDAAEVMNVARTWMAAWQAGDLDTLMGVYCEDVVLALHGQTMRRGVDEVRAFFDGNIGRPDASMRIDLETLRVRGSTAWFTSKYWLTIGTGEDRIEDAGRSLLVFERAADGAWQLCADIDQATPDVVFPAPEVSNFQVDP